MTVATGAALLSQRLTMGEVFALVGFTTFPVVASAWVVRRSLFKSVMRVLLRLLYRGGGRGRARPCRDAARGHCRQPRVVPRRPAAGRVSARRADLAVDTFIAKKWWAKPFLAVVNAFPVDPTNPLSIRAMIRAVEAGSACIIFPEGRITTTGGLMVYEGPAVIAERTKAALVMVRIEGAEFTPFSRTGRQGAAAVVPACSHPNPAAAPADALKA